MASDGVAPIVASAGSVNMIARGTLRLAFLTLGKRAALRPAMAPSTCVIWSTVEPISLPVATSKRYSDELLPDSFCIAAPARLPS